MSNQVVQLTIDDTSPSISYSPIGDTLSTPNLRAGWNPYFDQTGFASAQGLTGRGTSYHISSLDGASLALQWHGTGIQLFGNTTSSSYSIDLDGAEFRIPDRPSDIFSSSPEPNVILADIQGLEDKRHTIVLTARIPPRDSNAESSMLVFDKAIATSSPLPPSSDPDMQPRTESINDNQIAFRGRWTFKESPEGASFHSSSTINDTATATFNGTTFAVQGLTSPTAGNYTVKVDNITSNVLSARSSFEQWDTLLFFADGLDTSVLHTVEVTHRGDGELALVVGGFSSIVAWVPSQAPAPSDTSAANQGSSSFPKGTIAAFVLAGLLSFVLLTGMLYFFCIWRPRLIKRRADRVNSMRFRGTTSSSTHAQSNDRPYSGYGRVFDITRRTDSKDDLAIDTTTPHRRPGTGASQRSGRSGFGKWTREAVEGSMRGMGLAIRFRRSEEDLPEKSPGGLSDLDMQQVGPNGRWRANSDLGAYGYGDGPALPYGHERRQSDGATDSSGRRNMAATAMANLKNKGKARQITGASTPDSKYRLDLPLPSPGGASERSSRSGLKFKWNFPSSSKVYGQHSLNRSTSLSNHLSHGQSQPPSPLPAGSEGDALSSFVAADPSPIATRRPHLQLQMHEREHALPSPISPLNVIAAPIIVDHPPSYADSTSGSTSPRSPRQSLPQSVSHSNYPPATHGRDSSRGFLLHAADGDESFDESPERDPPHQPHPLPPPPATPPLASSSSPALLAASGHNRTDRGSASTDSQGKESSILGPSSVRQVIRSLSPRTVRTNGAGQTSRSGNTGPMLGALLTVPTQQRRSSGVPETLASSDMGPSPVVEFARNLTPSVVPLTPATPATAERKPSGDVPQGQESRRQSQRQSHVDDSELGDSTFLDVRSTSPFQVEFDLRSQNKQSRFSGVASEVQTKRSSDQSGPLASQSRWRLTNETIPSLSRAVPVPSSPTSEGGIGPMSFLDFTSSREGSVRSRSTKTTASSDRVFGGSGVVPPLPRSRWSNTTVPTISTGPSVPPSATVPPLQELIGESSEDSPSSKKAATGLSEGEASGSGQSLFPIPVQLSIPPSPHHIMDTSQPPSASTSDRRRSAVSNITTDNPVHVHPNIGNLESPTETVPVSITGSDELRYSDEAGPSAGAPDSRRTTESSIAFLQPRHSGNEIQYATRRYEYPIPSRIRTGSTPTTPLSSPATVTLWSGPGQRSRTGSQPGLLSSVAAAVPPPIASRSPSPYASTPPPSLPEKETRTFDPSRTTK